VPEVPTALQLPGEPHDSERIAGSWPWKAEKPVISPAFPQVPLTSLAAKAWYSLSALSLVANGARPVPGTSWASCQVPSCSRTMKASRSDWFSALTRRRR
jgi:hypothetical protein